MALRRRQGPKNKTDAQAEWGRRTMTGSGNRQDAAQRSLRALALACLLLIVGGCTTDMSGAGSPLDSALYSDPPAVTGSVAAAADIDPAAATSAPAGGTRIALVTNSLTPAPAGRAEELSRAMTEMLSARGYRLVPPPLSPAPGERPYFVAANFAIEPNGRGEKVGIDWVVSDALGEPVGKISQARTLVAHPTPEQWRTETLLAAAAATEGIAQLVPVQP